MNLVAEAPPVLVGLFALFLLAGAVEDAVRLRISNLICLAILLLAVAAAVASGIELAIWQNLLVFAALLSLGTVLFSTGKFGGGDVKLLAVTGLWFDLTGALGMLAAVFIAGGVLALLIIGGRALAPESLGRRVAVLKPGSGIPYGVAIAVGTLITIGLERL